MYEQSLLEATSQLKGNIAWNATAPILLVLAVIFVVVGVTGYFSRH